MNLDWSYRKINDSKSPEKNVAFGNTILSDFEDRFWVKTKTRASYLLITSIQTNDTGEYICKESKSGGDSKGTYLFVKEIFETTEAEMGPTTHSMYTTQYEGFTITESEIVTGENPPSDSSSSQHGAICVAEHVAIGILSIGIGIGIVIGIVLYCKRRRTRGTPNPNQPENIPLQNNAQQEPRG